MKEVLNLISYTWLPVVIEFNCFSNLFFSIQYSYFMVVILPEYQYPYTVNLQKMHIYHFLLY